MNRHQGVIDKSLEEFTAQVNIEGTDQRTREFHVEHQPGRPDRSITTATALHQAAHRPARTGRRPSCRPMPAPLPAPARCRISRRCGARQYADHPSPRLPDRSVATRHLIKHVIEGTPVARRDWPVPSRSRRTFIWVSSVFPADFGLPHAHLNAMLHGNKRPPLAATGTRPHQSIDPHDTISGFCCIRPCPKPSAMSQF